MKRNILLLIAALMIVCAQMSAQVIRVRMPIYSSTTITGATNDSVTVSGWVFPSSTWNTTISFTEQGSPPDSIRLTWSGVGSALSPDSISVYWSMKYAQSSGLYNSTSLELDSIKAKSVGGFKTIPHAAYDGMTYMRIIRKGTFATGLQKNGYVGSTLHEAALDFYYHK